MRNWRAALDDPTLLPPDGVSVGEKVKGGAPDPSLAVPIGLGMAL